jgi:hypothetical protein
MARSRPLGSMFTNGPTMGEQLDTLVTLLSLQLTFLRV